MLVAALLSSACWHAVLHSGWFPQVTGGVVSLQEEKDKVQAQKEEVLSHMNDVLENELQCIICSEYFIELSMNSALMCAR